MATVKFATIEQDGWALVSGEERHAAHPDTFTIPPRQQRESLSTGDGAKLLFDIETRENGLVVDRGIDRMWVIVRARLDGVYRGVLDNDPGRSELSSLRIGTEVLFKPEHVVDINQPPREYVLERYGPHFFDQ